MCEHWPRSCRTVSGSPTPSERERLRHRIGAGPHSVLTLDDVHVWSARLDLLPPEVEALSETLSDDELVRARRFVVEHGRRRFIVGRGLLRRLLARYSGVDPSRLEFSYGPHGKPALAGPTSMRSLRFNLAHSADLALY